MKGIMYVLYGVSILLFCGMIRYFLDSKRPGVYPPRIILRKRSAFLGFSGILFLLLGSIFYYLQ